MILIASTLLLCMVSVGHGNPLPEPNPDPNMIIQVRQVIHRRNCNKPHDQEGLYGHPTTEASVDVETPVAPLDVETPVAPVDVDALVNQTIQIQTDIIKAEQEIVEAQLAIDELEDEVAEDQAEIDEVDDILGDLSSLFDSFGRKRRSLSENIKGFLGVLDNIMGGSHRSRRDSSAEITISYCPDGDLITGTGFNVFGTALTDITAAINPLNLPLALCLKAVLGDLKVRGISLTADEITTLKAQAKAAEDEAEAVKQEKEQALVAKKEVLAVKEAEVAVLEEEVKVLEEEKAAVEEAIASVTSAPVVTITTPDAATTTDDIATTDDIQ